MLSNIKTIMKIINSGKTSIRRMANNDTRVLDSTSFKGLPLNLVDEMINEMAVLQRGMMIRKGIPFLTLDALDVKVEGKIFDTVKMFLKDKGPSLGQRIHDSIYNPRTGINAPPDPTPYSNITPNIWISPYEANALYSQKGIPEVIVNKKSKSILLNGVKIKNALLTADEIDRISLNMLRLNVPQLISDCVRDSLVYGGNLLFPLFKKDNPLTMLLSLEALIKNGVLAQGTISRFISLDRWNVMHLPSTNPTQSDFINPHKYFIPFMGADVNGSRCARIVTSSQAGYLGKIMTLGWGLSDFCAYIESVKNYKIAVQTLPLMIQQMSILARTINIDGLIAQEGPEIMRTLMEGNTINISEWSPSNPVTMDVIGELKAINRDFADVKDLIRLLRQDLCADAMLPEPLIFSSERGSFSSGDTTQGEMTKEDNSLKTIHKDVEGQFKQLAKMLVIDTLGVSERIIKALPYTHIHFDVPMVANSVERAEIGLNIGKSFFEFVSGQMPLDAAARIASGYGGDELSMSSELLDELEARQKKADEDQKKKMELELELLEAQVEATKAGVKAPSAPSSEESSRYSRLEQEHHEKSKMPGQRNMQSLQKAQNKRV